MESLYRKNKGVSEKSVTDLIWTLPFLSDYLDVVLSKMPSNDQIVRKTVQNVAKAPTNDQVVRKTVQNVAKAPTNDQVIRKTVQTSLRVASHDQVVRKTVQHVLKALASASHFLVRNGL